MVAPKLDGCGERSSRDITLVFWDEEAKGWPVGVGGIDGLLVDVHGIELNVRALVIMEVVECPCRNILDVGRVDSFQNDVITSS